MSKEGTEKEFKIDQSAVHFIPGMSIKQNCKPKGPFISQSKYIKRTSKISGTERG